MLPAPLSGIVTPLVTPLDTDGNLDCGSLERLLEHVIAGKVSGVFLLGTTGEGPSLHERLREQVVRKSCAMVAGRIPVLVSVSDTAVYDSLRMAAIAEEAGASAVVLAPPFYFRYSQSDLLRYVELVEKQVSPPIFLYNIPQLTKVGFAVETVRRVAEMPGVVGLKDSSGDLGYLAEVVAAVKGRADFSVLVGPEEMLIDAMKAGAHGGVCGGSNLNPKLFQRLAECAGMGLWDEAAECQDMVLRLSRALYTTGDEATSYLRGLKYALELAGLCRHSVAPPLSPFTPGELAVFARRYQSVVG